MLHVENLRQSEGAAFPHSFYAKWPPACEGKEVVSVAVPPAYTGLVASTDPTSSWKSGTSSVAMARRGEFEALENFYVFRERARVAAFLEEHPFLIALLFEAYGQVKQHFGSQPFIFLEVVTDTEAADDRELYAFIPTHLPPEEALKKLEQFDNAWWLGAMGRAEGALCIDVEFQ